MPKKLPPRSVQELNLSPRGPMHPSPSDWRDHFIYFLLIDRFDNNERPIPPYDGTRSADHRDPHAGSMAQGGTLKGAARRLSYIKKLGATTIWLSPVLKNRPEPSGTFHGYAIQHFLDIDPKIGTKKDLVHFVKKAHELGLYVIMDIVINHTGDNWAYVHDSEPLFRHDGTQYPFEFWRAKHPPENFGPDDAVWPAELQSPDCYKRRGRIVDWNNMDESVNGDFFNLKALELNNPFVLETLKTIFKYWIVETDIDGYRIDTVKHVENGPAVAFCNAMKEFAEGIGKKNFFLFGEIIADDQTITTYVGGQSPAGERIQALDAALDFPLYFVLEEVIKGFVSPVVLRERYERIKYLYPNTDSSDSFVTFLDNHDQMARPHRRFLHDVPDEQQALLAVGYLLTSTGIPTLYYGTEQGFDGGGSDGDAHVRECMFGGNWGAFGTSGMHFFNPRHPLYKGIAKIASLRKEEPALRYGRMYFREVSEDGTEFRPPALGFGMIAFSRILDSDELLVVLNLRNTPYENYIVMDKALTPSGTLLINLLNKKEEVLVEERLERAVARVTLSPHGMAILKKKDI